MKKIIYLVGCGIVLGGFLSSCSSTAVYATNNPVGSKTKTVKGNNFQSNIDVTYSRAAKEGDIDKIGLRELKTSSFLIFIRYKTTITGE